MLLYMLCSEARESGKKSFLDGFVPCAGRWAPALLVEILDQVRFCSHGVDVVGGLGFVAGSWVWVHCWGHGGVIKSSVQVLGSFQVHKFCGVVDCFYGLVVKDNTITQITKLPNGYEGAVG